MSTKVIKIPEKSVPVTDPDGKPTGEKRNLFKNFLAIVLESTPQNGDTETFLAHSIREKLDALTDGEAKMEMEAAEITFIEGGIAEIRKNGRMAGSGWYYLIDALRSAEAKKKETKT